MLPLAQQHEKRRFKCLSSWQEPRGPTEESGSGLFRLSGSARSCWSSCSPGTDQGSQPAPPWPSEAWKSASSGQTGGSFGKERTARCRGLPLGRRGRSAGLYRHPVERDNHLKSSSLRHYNSLGLCQYFSEQGQSATTFAQTRIFLTLFFLNLTEKLRVVVPTVL